MTTGDTVAIVAVGLNALMYVGGAFKLSGTVSNLEGSVRKFERLLETIANKINKTEVDIAILQHNCKIYHETK